MKGVHEVGLDKSTRETKTSLQRALLLCWIILVAFNLRPAITSVGPVVSFIQKDLQLSHWSAGMLTSLPLLAFAIISPLVPRLAARFSNEWASTFGLLFILFGIMVRSLFYSVFLLFVGTLLIGVGIAICNVLLPVIVRARYPEKVGPMTSVYSTSIGIMASIASGISVPLAVDYHLGWKSALSIWMFPAVMAIFLWLYLTKFYKRSKKSMENRPKGFNRMWKSSFAWQIALFFGFQSILFYVTITWLPEILVYKGFDIEMAGWLLSITQIIGLPASFIVPVLAGRLQSQSLLAALLGIMAAAGYGILLASNSFTMVILSTALIGLPLSGCFALGLVFIAIRAQNSMESADLSGMVQSFGYLLSAIGPILIGYLFDHTQSWLLPLITLIGISVLVAFFGMVSGRNRYV